MTLQVRTRGNLQGARDMQNNLCQRMAIYVVTAIGLTVAYSVIGGVVQGGGMDPFFYIWNSLLLHAVRKYLRGVPVRRWDGTTSMSMQTVVDDTTMWVPSLQDMAHNMHMVVHTLRWLNAKCGPETFGFLVYACENEYLCKGAGTLTVDGQNIVAAGPSDYVNFLGGNANLLHEGAKDISSPSKHARHLQVRLNQHPPCISMTLAIISGVLVARWRHKRIVHRPQHITDVNH